MSFEILQLAWNDFSSALIYIIIGYIGLFMLMGTMLHRRRYWWLVIVFMFCKSFYAQIISTLMGPVEGADEIWLYLSLINSVVLPLLTFTIFCLCFRGSILQVIFSSIFGEIIGVGIGTVAVGLSSMLLGKGLVIMHEVFAVENLLAFPIFAVLFGVLYIPARPMLLRYRDYEMKHKKVLGTACALYLISNMSSYFWDFRMYYTISWNYGLLMVGQMGMLCTVAYIVLRYLRRKVTVEHDYLNRQQELMKTHYEAMKMNRLENCSLLLAEQMEEITAMDVSELNTRRAGNYLSCLKQEYEKVRAGVFCDDGMIDAILYYQSEQLKKQNILLDCTCRGYVSGKIEKHDMSQIVFQMIELGRQQILNRKKKIKTEDTENIRTLRLTLGTVSGQTILIMKWEKKQKGRMEQPRWLKPYLKKYHGALHMEHKEGWQELKISLTNQ